MVVGLGPAGPDELTVATRAAIERVARRFLRTSRHPAAVAVPDARSFDDVYDAAESFEEVYARIVDVLIDEATSHGEVLYAVPGSPRVAERTVELLIADERVEATVLPALSFLDLAWARLGVDPVAVGVRVVDGRRFAVEAAGEPGPLLVAQCDAPHVLSDIKLAAGHELDPATPVTVLHHLGLPDESVRTVPWCDLDRAVEPDHLTSLWIPELTAPVAVELARFEELVRTLRARCPWDREQTHQTLTRHLLEETYEVLEAIGGLGRPGGPAHLEEELGDLLFQVVFHATLAAEAGEFTLADVARTIHEKLVLRHPHVFGQVQADSADAVMASWERNKQAEKGRSSLMDGIPADLPALLYAHKIQRKAAAVGIGVNNLSHGEGAPTSTLVAELGEVLFAVVGLARRDGVDPEAALRGAAAAFRDRFVALEELAGQRGLELRRLDQPTLDALWAETGASSSGSPSSNSPSSGSPSSGSPS